ncbi:MAG: NF038122 family metalloprotease [Pyrinomonadaceae bacterium]
MTADSKSANDAKAIATVPATAQTANIAYGAANGRAVGLNTPGQMCADSTINVACTFDGIVTIVSSQPFSFSRPLAANTYDAQRSIEHEVDEVLGTGSGIDLNNPITRYRPLDLWTWSAPGTRNVTSTGSRYFSLDSGATNIVGLNQTAGGDFGDFISLGCPQANPFVQNAFSCPNQFSDVTPSSPEGILIDVMGFDTNITSAATVTVAGRVLSADGIGIRNARVLLDDGSGRITAATNAFGYFEFDSVQSGTTCLLSGSARGYTITPQVISVKDSLSDLTLTALR